MSMQRATQKQTIILDPDCRGGSSAPVRVRDGDSLPRVPQAGDSFMAKVLSDLRYDQNLIYLATRLTSYAELCEARLASLRQAVAAADSAAIEEIAHALTDLTSRLGAVGLMKLCIGLQMMGRRGLVGKAEALMHELESEYKRFKQSLISAVG